MTQAVEVYVPCSVVTVTVTVAPEEHLSPLEVLFLRATCNGITSFAELADLFGLGQRITLDLISALWRARFVDIDMASARVLPRQQVTEAHDAGRLADLRSAEARDEPQKVMQELLSGHVLAIDRARSVRVSAKTVVPVDMFDIGVTQLAPPALLAALRDAVSRSRDDGGRRPKILAAHLAAGNLTTDGERRWLPLLVRATEDPGSQQLSVQVLDESLPLAVRARMAEQISLIAERRPESPFVQHLGEQGYTEPAIPTDVRQNLGRLRKALITLAGVEPSLRAQRHGELLGDFEEVHGWCTERLGSDVAIEVVAGRLAHERKAEEMVDAAQRQLVIASPWLGGRALERLLPAVRRALEREVDVYLLWGIDRLATVDADVLNNMTLLAGEFRRFLHWTERSAGTHAKLLVQDGGRALVTSWNALSAPSDSTFELGLVIGSAQPGRTARPIEDLLGWAQSQYPDYIESRLMCTLAEDFALARDEHAVAGDPPPIAAQVVAPGRPGEPHSDPQIDTGVANLWVAAWSAAVTGLEQLERGARRQCATVRRDGQHRTALWRAIRSARERLVVCSDQLGPDVVDDAFIAALTGRLEDGLHIGLIWSRGVKHAGGSADDPLQRLEALAEQYPDRLTLVNVDKTHAKLVVADDLTLVSSFNFLSFEGYYEVGDRGGRRQRTELGVEVTGTACADAVLAAVVSGVGSGLDRLPAAMAPEEPTEQPLAAVAPAGPIVRLAGLLSEAATESEGSEAIAGALLEAADTGALLEQFDAAAVPLSILRPAVAAAVLGLGLDQHVRESWMAWLAADAWRERRFIEAAALTGVFTTRRPRPDAPTHAEAVVFASLGTQHFDDAVLHALEADLDPQERACLAIGGMLALVFEGAPDGEALLDASGSLPDAWQRVVEAAGRYWTDAMYRPLPVARIEQAVDASRQHAAQDGAWQELAQALESARSKNFAFGSGKKTRMHLFRAESPFGRLEAVVAKRDAERLQAWVSDHAKIDVGAFLDDATREVTGRTDQLLARGTRQDYLARLTRVFDGARAAATASPVESDVEDSTRMRAAATLRDVVRAAWDEIDATTTGAVVVDTAAAVAADRLRALAEWNP